MRLPPISTSNSGTALEPSVWPQVDIEAAQAVTRSGVCRGSLFVYEECREGEGPPASHRCERQGEGGPRTRRADEREEMLGPPEHDRH